MATVASSAVALITPPPSEPLNVNLNDQWLTAYVHPNAKSIYIVGDYRSASVRESFRTLVPAENLAGRILRWNESELGWRLGTPLFAQIELTDAFTHPTDNAPCRIMFVTNDTRTVGDRTRNTQFLPKQVLTGCFLKHGGGQEQRMNKWELLPHRSVVINASLITSADNDLVVFVSADERRPQDGLFPQFQTDLSQHALYWNALKAEWHDFGTLQVAVAPEVRFFQQVSLTNTWTTGDVQGTELIFVKQDGRSEFHQPHFPPGQYLQGLFLRYDAKYSCWNKQGYRRMVLTETFEAPYEDLVYISGDERKANSSVLAKFPQPLTGHVLFWHNDTHTWSDLGVIDVPPAPLGRLDSLSVTGSDRCYGRLWYDR